ncbi:hypothetical protein KAR91_11215 [Candidatus Pacearchaeota archaeon]|nr:hypothetical protein [Candidatus Pacearchaeota archaeon]
MKKKLFVILVLMFLAAPCMAEDGDLIITRVIEDVDKAPIDTFKILAFTKTAIITYREVDANGNSTGVEFDELFINASEDDLNTAWDETQEFTDFYNYIHVRIRAGDSLKAAITKAVEIKRAR